MKSSKLFFRMPRPPLGMCLLLVLLLELPASALDAAEPALTLRLLDLGDVLPPDASEASVIEAAVEPSRGWAEASILPMVFPIYPFGGVQDVDVHAHDYVDLDASSGLQDWDCGERTYDGHDATDFWIPGFGHQDGRVPVFAVAAGTVIHAQDGYPDRQKECSWGTENYVQVDHGDGLVTGYGHLRRNSVRVALGQAVEAGEELGEIASSGCSYWPHLHFVTRLDGQAVEPHTGACNPAGSGWKKQRPIRDETWLWDFGFSHKHLDDLKPGELPPEPMPCLGRFGRKDRRINAWAYILNLEPAMPYRVRLFAPDGALGYDSGPLAMDNQERMRLAVAWLTLETRELGKQWGTWILELSLDGEVVIEAPFDFEKKRKRKLNRPPVRPKKVAFEPRRPREGEPLSCVAKLDRLLDDPDYDIVRYYFEWRIDGEVVRERTWAARSDVLAAGMLEAGDRVTCTVVPLDDRSAGEARSRKVRVR